MNTWYKLGRSLDAFNFKPAVRRGDNNWNVAWGAGTTMFWLWEDNAAITDSTNRTVAMTDLAEPVVGQVFWIDTPDWHPWEFSARVNRNVHNLNRWYMRFQSTSQDMYVIDPITLARRSVTWGDDGMVDFVVDRESMVTHEWGHVIPLMHPDTLRGSDIQTMWAWWDQQYWNKTGNEMHSITNDDIFGYKKLYPSNLQ